MYSLLLSSLLSNYKTFALASPVDSIAKSITLSSIEFIINSLNFASLARSLYFIITSIKYSFNVIFIFISEDKREKKEEKEKKKDKKIINEIKEKKNNKRDFLIFLSSRRD